MKAINLIGTTTTQPPPLLSPRVRQALRSAVCWAWNGGHDLHRAHDDARIYQRCHCGYETKGWTIDRRDRRLHWTGRHE